LNLQVQNKVKMEKGKSVGNDLISSISLSKKGTAGQGGSDVISSISLSKKGASKGAGPAKPQGFEFGKSGKYTV
jgi:hypothetical protein